MVVVNLRNTTKTSTSSRMMIRKDESKKNFLAVRDGIPKLEFDTTLDFLIIEYTIVP